MSFTAETTTVSAIAMVSAASNNTATATGESSTDSTDSNTPPPSTQEYLLSIENTEEYGTILHAMSTCLPDAMKSTALLATLLKNKSIQKKSTNPNRDMLFNEIFRRDPTMKMSSQNAKTSNDKTKWLKNHPLSSEDQQDVSAALEAHYNDLHEQFNNNKNIKTQQPVGITKTNKRSMRLTECCFDESLKASLLSKFDSKNR